MSKRRLLDVLIVLTLIFLFTNTLTNFDKIPPNSPKFLLVENSSLKITYIPFHFILLNFFTYRIIKMSSPRINNAICFGCILCYLSVFLYGLDSRFISVDLIPWTCNVRFYMNLTNIF